MIIQLIHGDSLVQTQSNTYKRKIAESLLMKKHSIVTGNKNSFPLSIFKI